MRLSHAAASSLNKSSLSRVFLWQFITRAPVVQRLARPIYNSESRKFDSRPGHENFRCPGRAWFLLIPRGKYSPEYMCVAH